MCVHPSVWIDFSEMSGPVLLYLALMGLDARKVDFAIHHGILTSF